MATQSNLRRHHLLIPDDAQIDPSLRDLLNSRFQKIQEQLAAQAGLAGSTVGFAGDIDLRGHVIKNSGPAVEPNDLASAAHVEKAASVSAQAVLLQQYTLDLTQAANADELFDLGPPGAVQSLTLEWLKKTGWIARWDEPVNVVKTIGYYVTFYNDAAGVVYMNPETGAVVATQALAERFVETNHYTTNLNEGDLVAPFSATGAKIRVVALVKIAGQGKQRGAAVDYGSLVGPNGDPGLQPVTFTGSDVPLAAMGLERTGTGGTGSLNSTTLYQLDAGASSVVGAYVGTTDDWWALYIPTVLGFQNPCAVITAYDPVTKYVTVAPPMNTIIGGGFAFEIHRGISIAGISGISHTPTTFNLDHAADSHVSTVSGHYKGKTLYVPHLPAGQQIQKITASTYNGGTQIHALTYEPAAAHVAPAGNPTNNCNYMISDGAFGYANNDMTGRIAPAPFREWLDFDSSSTIFEPIPPLDYNLQRNLWTANKKSSGKITDTRKLFPDDPYPLLVAAATRMVSVQFRNLFRGVPTGTSDGRSLASVYVASYVTADLTVSPPTFYSPTDFTPIEKDYQGVFPI